MWMYSLCAFTSSASICDATNDLRGPLKLDRAPPLLAAAAAAPAPEPAATAASPKSGGGEPGNEKAERMEEGVPSATALGVARGLEAADAEAAELAGTAVEVGETGGEDLLS